MENNFLTISNFSTDKNTELYMTFSLSGKVYAILAEKIIEIVQLPALTVLEKVPEYIVGMLNLRGKIINVIDLRKFLGIPQTSYTADHQVMIIDAGNKAVGIVVDSVFDVIQFDRNNLEPLPYKSSEKFISGIYKNDENLIAFLDLDILISNVESIEANDPEFSVHTHYSAELFPIDPVSLEKFKKRAINLQKELKVDINRDNYQENRFVSFSLNNEVYCISLKFVKEFCKLKQHISLTKVPCVPSFITGLINHRGEFITIIDIKSFLQIPKTEITDKSKIIVTKSGSLQVGLLVDEVFDIINISEDKLSLSHSAKFDKNKYTSAELILETGGIINILDLEKLLQDESLLVEDAV